MCRSLARRADRPEERRQLRLMAQHARAGPRPRRGGKEDDRLALPDLSVDPAHPVKEVLLGGCDRAVMLGEGDQHRFRRADQVEEAPGSLRDTGRTLAIDGVDRHFEVGQVDEGDLRFLRHRGAEALGGEFNQGAVDGIAAVGGRQPGRVLR